tara:strand:- start:2487 stop:2759 length:273 start_codon:yes stop_codon:yes gene_type:complete
MALTDISLVSQFEIARAVANEIEKSEPTMAKQEFLPGSVIKVIATIAKFVQHFSRKVTHTTPVLCDIPVFGKFIIFNSETGDLKYSFIPS